VTRSQWSFIRLTWWMAYMSGEPYWDCASALRRSEGYRVRMWRNFQLWLKENP
jgi:hypothetical protein